MSMTSAGLFVQQQGRAALMLAACLMALMSACKRRADTTNPEEAAVRTPMPTPPTAPAGTDFDCAAPVDPLGKLICGDSTLTARNGMLISVYTEATGHPAGGTSSRLAAEQQTWVREREACLTRTAARACVDSAYVRRIAEIQALSLLVPTKGPIAYACPKPDGSSDQIEVMYADTDPPTAVLVRGDKTVVTYLGPSGSGARYLAPDVIFWEKGGEATVTWGGTKVVCRERAPSS